MSIKITKKDIIWSYIGLIVSMSFNLLLLPILIIFLDTEMLGLWYVFTSIGAIAALSDFGFAITFSRNITYCWSGARELRKENVSFTQVKEPDYKMMCKVLQACKMVYFRISVFSLFLLLTVGLSYILYITKQIEGYHHIIAWIVFSFAVFLNLYFGYYASFLRGVGDISDANKNTIIARIAQLLFTIILLICGCGIIGVCVAYLVYGTLFRLLGKYKFYKYKDIGVKIRSINIDEIEKQEIHNIISIVWHNAWRDGVISITGYLSNQASTLICSLFLSLTETAIYSIGVQIAMALVAVSATAYYAYQPQLQSAYINCDRELTLQSLGYILISFFGLFVISLLGVVFVVLPILQIVKPEVVISLPILLGLCLYHFILQYRSIFCTYYSCTNRIPYLKSFIIASLLCVLLSLMFVGYYHKGMYGLILAQFLSQLVFNAWYWPYKAKKELKITLTELMSIGWRQISIIMKDRVKLIKMSIHI